MTYNHTMVADIHFKRHVTIEQVKAAIVPFVKERNWATTADGLPEEVMINGDNIATDHDGKFVHRMEIFTAGDVRSNYAEVVHKFAKGLTEIAKAGFITMYNYSSTGLDNSTWRIWYGEQSAVAKAKEKLGWQEAIQVLKDAGVDASTRKLISRIARHPEKYLNEPQHDSTSEPFVGVRYWDSASEESQDGVDPYSMRIVDQRSGHGQAFVDIVPADDPDGPQQLSVSLEINRLPGSKEDVPCARLHFDGNRVAASFYKQEHYFIVRPENGVSIRNTVLPNGEKGWILE